MIVGYHIIFGTYGFWLPNDPAAHGLPLLGRGSCFALGQPQRQPSGVRSRTVNTIMRNEWRRNKRCQGKQLS